MSQKHQDLNRKEARDFQPKAVSGLRLQLQAAKSNHRDRTWRVMVYGDCYVIISVYFIKPQSIPATLKCLLRNNHCRPRLAKYDQGGGGVGGGWTEAYRVRNLIIAFS